jgi:type I restriction enzyme S subunit
MEKFGISNVPNLRFPEFEGKWEERKLGEVCDLITKGTTPKQFTDNGIRYIKIEAFEDNYIDIDKCVFIAERIHNTELRRSILKENDILFAIAGATIGKTNIVTKNLLPANTNQALAIIRLKETENRNFILQVLKSQIMQKYIKNSISVGAQPNLNLEQMNNFSFVYPPLPEQERLANLFTLIDDRISTQMKIIEKLESLIKGVANFVFYSNKYQFSKSTLGTLCKIKKGEQINSSELSESGDFYVMNGGITPSGYHTEYNSEAETISISEGGNSCGYVQYNTSKFWSGGHCYTLIDVEGVIANKYLFHYLKTHEQDIMALRVGSGLPNIQKKDLEKFEVLLPTSEEQKEIVRLLDSLANKIEVEKNMLSAYQSQKTYFLNQMFI